MKIMLHFAGSNSVPFEIVQHYIGEVLALVLEVEVAETKRIRKEIPEIPKASIDNAVEKMNSDQLFRVSAVKPGSFEMVFALTALGWWALDKTIGDTVTEAWKQTEMQERIKRYFLKGKKEKLQAIQSKINQKIEKPSISVVRTSYTLEVDMYARVDKEREIINIRINYEDGYVDVPHPPTWEELESGE